MFTQHTVLVLVLLKSSFVLVHCQIRELILGDFPHSSITYKNVKDVLYHLYTHEFTNSPVNLNETTTELNNNLDVKVIIHGFTENSGASWYRDMVQAYLQNRNLNIIAIDWSKRAKRPYINAVKESQLVGKAIGNFLIELNDNEKIEVSRTHIIGHSLGSHVAGFAGKHIHTTAGKRLQRITGLDPAGPLFEFPFIGVEDRLSKNDAEFVDIIHTDSGILGFKSSIGDADYFPNGGNAIQPGCKPPQLNNILEYVCSHQRSHQYFIESINSNTFIAKACDSWSSYQMGFCNLNENVLFGEHASPNFTGTFFLQTGSTPPFSSM